MFTAKPAAHRIGAPHALPIVIAVCAVVMATVSGCALGSATDSNPSALAPAGTAADQQVPIYSDITVAENLVYGPDKHQRLDVCQPSNSETSLINNGPRRAVLSVHGGSWRAGDKADAESRSICEWLASEGFIAFSMNYALAPQNPYPAAITDVQTAVEWLRNPAQVASYDYNPALIGALGASAGGNLVTLLGASGTGKLDAGTRVAAVVELSGPIDLSEATTGHYSDRFIRYQLEYLGCESYTACTTAPRASPLPELDPSDPPVFIAHSAEEFIPLAQSELLAEALTANNITHEYVVVPGTAHSLAMLDDTLRTQIAAFLRTHL